MLDAEGGGQSSKAVIAGLANSYASYCATFEEYQAQRYEAASTIYGPHALAAYTQEAVRLVRDMAAGRDSDTCDAPPDLSAVQLNLLPDARPDAVPVGSRFGEVTADVAPGTTVGPGDIVSAEFWSANPRHDQRLQGTYLTVERKAEQGRGWDVAYTDGDWCTRFIWRFADHQLIEAVEKHSLATVEFTVPDDVAKGTYRLCHQGAALRREPVGVVEQFSGCSAAFVVSYETVLERLGG